MRGKDLSHPAGGAGAVPAYGLHKEEKYVALDEHLRADKILDIRFWVLDEILLNIFSSSI